MSVNTRSFLFLYAALIGIISYFPIILKIHIYIINMNNKIIIFKILSYYYNSNT